MSSGADPRPWERGLLPLRVFTADEHGAGTQSFSLAASEDGRLWVGTLRGILAWDGAWWRLHERSTATFAVAADERGRVAWGGVDDLGILVPDATGGWELRSLADRIAEERIGDVRSVAATRTGFAYLSDRALLHWSVESESWSAAVPEAGSVRGLHAVGDEAWLWTLGHGLQNVGASDLEAVEGGETFRERPVRLVVRNEAGEVLVHVRGEGLLRWTVGATATRSFAPAAGTWLDDHEPTSAVALPRGGWALGSRSGGVLLVDAEGEVEQILDGAAGLADDHTRDLLVDREDFLWIASDNSLARVDVASPLTLIDDRSGLRGSLWGLGRHRDRLWISTSTGVYELEGGDHARATRRAGVPAGISDPISVGSHLLVGTRQGVWLSEDGSSWTRVSGTADVVAYALVASLRNPDCVWVGARRGLGSIARSGGEWVWQGFADGTPPYARSIVERAEALWVGTVFDGLVVWDLAETGSADGQPQSVAAGEASLAIVGDELTTARVGERPVPIDERGRRLLEPGGPTALFTPEDEVFQLVEDAHGNVWGNSLPPVVVVRSDDGWSRIPLHSVASSDLQMLQPEPDGVVWLGTERGLYRYAGPVVDRRARLPAPAIRRVVVDGEGTIHDGGLDVPVPRELGPRPGRLRVELAPRSALPGLEYRIRLHPVDPEEVEWRSAPVVEYTNLQPGEYRLSASMRGPGLEPGPETTWMFTVRAPWTDRWWARGLAGLVGVAALAFFLRRRSRALRHRARALERQVHERTEQLERTVAELRSARDEILHKNELLSKASRRWRDLSLHDELTGLANRRAFDRALEREWSRAARHRHPISLVLMDLDRFKLLNDRQGHAAGDEALRRIGGWLAERIRRTTDVVARYGGEEIAILLPSTGREGATDLAEGLRREVAELGISHDGLPGGVLTASFGLGTVVPDEARTIEDFFAAVDRALYRAKDLGRDRVETVS